MGPIMEKGMAGTEWYYWSIQWFLHFQFNGWLWFAVMAVGSRWAERHGVEVHLDTTTVMLWALGTVLTYALAVAWIERHVAVIAVNSIGVALQAVAAWRTLLRMRTARVQALVRTTRWMRVLIGAMFISMAVKITAQAMVALPAVATMALTLRNYVVGFVHLNTLGTATALLFAHAVMKGWFAEERRPVRLGLVSFLAGYACSELLLFAQGTCFWAGWGLLPGYYLALFAVSAVMALGIWTLLITALRPAS